MSAIQIASPCRANQASDVEAVVEGIRLWIGMGVLNSALACGTASASLPSDEEQPDGGAPPKMQSMHPVMDSAASTNERDLLPELWFPVGEEIAYKVYWGRIPVGYSVIATEWVQYEGETLLSIQVRTQSNKVLDKIYPVDDIIESLIDPETFLPVRFTVNLKEGRYRKHEITHFDYEEKIAYWRSETKDREDTFELEPNTRDLVSFAYYMRRVGFEPGVKQEFRVMSDEKIYDLWLESKGTERVRLPHYGRVRSVEVEPEAAFEGLFVRRGKITFWVSDDERRVMTKMVGQIPVASIRLVLHKVTGPGNDSWILDYEIED